MSRHTRMRRTHFPWSKTTRRMKPKDSPYWNCPRNNFHHRWPQCQGGTDDPGNLSYVNFKKHQAYHQLFGVMSVYEVAFELNKLWLPLNQILLPIPTDRVVEVLDVLKKMGVVPFTEPIKFGITQTHLDAGDKLHTR